MDTKQCPYCGEEIAAVAKKCKHCGEWLEPAATSAQKKMIQCPACAEEIEEGLEVCPVCNEAIANNNIDPPNYGLLSFMCYVAVFFEAISAIQDMGLEKGHGRLGFFVKLANLIPEWLVIICAGLLEIFLLMGLRKHYMMTRASKPIPFITLVCLLAGGMLFGLMGERVIGLVILIATAMAIIQFIVGLQLIKRLKEASSVGVMMMICAIVLPIILISGTAVSENEYLPWWAAIASSGISIIYYLILRMFFRINQLK